VNQRLNKYLAFQLGTSRREADDAIAAGEVQLNETVAELGARYTVGDTVTYKGKPIAPRKNYTYLMLNKPENYVSSRRQQGDSPTVYALLPEEHHNLKPVGRLDRNSSGLLLFTDDGDFAHSMTHPSFQKTKEYLIALDRALEPLHQQMVSDYGVQLEDGYSKLTLERQDDARLDWKVVMHEGRNRQIRRTFAALGYDVVKLHRTQFGPHALEELESGEYKTVSKQ